MPTDDGVHWQILTEDQMDNFSNTTDYLSGISSCNDTISAYLELGMPPEKGNLGMPFYGQGYSVEPDCKHGLGCKVVKPGEKKGKVVGQVSSFMWTAMYMDANPPSKNASVAKDGEMCGPDTKKICPGKACCSPSGYWWVVDPNLWASFVIEQLLISYPSGTTEDYCGWNCLPAWGHCNGSTSIGSFQKARKDKSAVTDQGAFYLDKENNFFWTWDPAENYGDKYHTVIKDNKLGGVMVWSLGEDSYDWSHLKKLSALIKQHRM